MSSFEYISRAEQARVLIVSQRRRLSVVSRCLDFEFEDLVAQVDAADILAPIHNGPRSPLVRRAARGLERLGAGPVSSLLSGESPPIDRRYDLVFFTCLSIRDVMALWPLRPWLRAARSSACYIDEVWAHRVIRGRPEVALLKQFDFLFVGYRGSVDAVAAATGRPTFHLPHSVNTQVFCPFPAQPARLIDVFAMGRCPRRTHDMLLRETSGRSWFYMYDTTGSGPVADPAEHRRRLAGLINRTRYFIVNPAWADDHEATGGQQELGFRFFEGTAGGAVLIGEPPNCPAFGELFPWEDAVVRLPMSSLDIGSVFDALEADPARVTAIRARNIRNSLLRHDSAYRWAQVLETVGMRPLSALERRRQALAERAGLFAGNIESASAAQPAEPVPMSARDNPPHQ